MKMILSDGGGGNADTGAEHREKMTERLEVKMKLPPPATSATIKPPSTTAAKTCCARSRRRYYALECAGATAAGSRQRHWYCEDLFPVLRWW